MSEMQYKAVKYIRLSYTDESNGESDSVVNQRKLLDSFLENHPDIEAVGERVDDGWSGVIFERPAFKEMMEDIRAGKINCVIVKDLSRLGREYIETGRHLREIFPAYGVRFIAVTDNIDTLKDNAKDIVVSIKSIINDAYCHDISTKTRSALSTKRGNGDYVGACTVYGYKKADANHNQLVIDEYPAGVVRDIFRMKLEGVSASKIAKTLNTTGILSPIEYKRDRGLPHPKNGFADKSDAKWSATTIIRILKDETYAGALIQGRQGTLNYKIKDVIDLPKKEWARIDNAHEAIIDPRDFELCQRVMHLDTRTAPGGDKVYLFSGVLICGCCGGRMTRKTDRKNGKIYYYYYCPTGKKNGCEHPNRIKEDALIACALESVKSHIVNVVSLESLLRSVKGEKYATKLARQYESHIAENINQLAKVGEFKSTLYENMVLGIISKEEFKTLRSNYAEDYSRITQIIATLKQEHADIWAGTGERLRWIEHFKRFEGLTALDRKTVTHLIQSIYVQSKTDLQITFNYQMEFDNAFILSSVVEEVA